MSARKWKKLGRILNVSQDIIDKAASEWVKIHAGNFPHHEVTKSQAIREFRENWPYQWTMRAFIKNFVEV